IDDIFILLLFGTGSRAAIALRFGRGAWSAAGLRTLRFVHLLGQLMGRLREQFHLLLDDIAFVGFERIAKLAQGAFNVGARLRIHLFAVLAERFFGGVGQTFALILQIDDLAPLL